MKEGNSSDVKQVVKCQAARFRTSDVCNFTKVVYFYNESNLFSLKTRVVPSSKNSPPR